MYIAQAFAVFSSANFQRSSVQAPFRANGWIVYQSARTRARGKFNFFQKSVLTSQKCDNSMQIAIYFNAEAQSRRVRRGSWREELELGSGIDIFFCRVSSYAISSPSTRFAFPLPQPRHIARRQRMTGAFTASHAHLDFVFPVGISAPSARTEIIPHLAPSAFRLSLASPFVQPRPRLLCFICVCAVVFALFSFLRNSVISALFGNCN